MATTQPVSLPYGCRDLTLTKYTDGSGTILASTSVDLTNSQTFAFSEAEDFAELRGDDKRIAVRGKGSSIDWTLDAGGINYPAWEILSGGVTVETGVTPNRITKYRKFSSAARPYFRLEGTAISDSGGDLHTIVYRCRANSKIDGSFKDGEFWVTSVSGVGLPLVNTSTFDLLYEFVQNETPVVTPLTPVANPTT